MNRYRLRLISSERLNRDVYRVRLDYAALAAEGVSFKAGQYLELFLPDGRSAYFSIASAPEASAFLELHIREMPESDLNRALMLHLQQADSIELCMAMGQCHLVAEELATGQVLCFVAGSTGFAQIKSMVEHLLHCGATQPMRFYWGAREADDLYLDVLARQWAADYPNFEYIPIISGDDVDAVDEQNSLPARVARDLTQPAEVRVYACGSPGMVYALVDALEACGVSERQIHADVFAYAPRPVRQA